MRVLVARPAAEDRERALGVFRDVRPDAPLGAEPLRELVLRAHRQLEVVEPALGDEERVREVEERRHPDADELVGGMFRAERAKQDLDGLGIILRQVRRQRARDVLAAVEQLEVVEPARRLSDEGARREATAGRARCQPASRRTSAGEKKVFSCSAMVPVDQEQYLTAQLLSQRASASAVSGSVK